MQVLNEWDFEKNELEQDSMYILRTKHTGALCGYVSVTKEHPLFGKDYSDRVKVTRSILDRTLVEGKYSVLALLPASLSSEPSAKELSIDLIFDVHGGITYSGDRKPTQEPDGLWWFGFDCAHHGDLLPYIDLDFSSDIYRNMEYVKAECESLAKQLEEFAANYV